MSQYTCRHAHWTRPQRISGGPLVAECLVCGAMAEILPGTGVLIWTTAGCRLVRDRYEGLWLFHHPK